MKLAIQLTLILLATAPRVAFAQDVSFLLCFPGGPGSSTDAKPVVDAFLGALKQSAGWTSVKGDYVNDAATCQAAMAAGGASVVVLPLDVYLERNTAWKLQPVATLANTETASRYHVLAKKGVTLEALKGQKIASGLAASAGFLGRVGFDGKVDLNGGASFVKARTALKALKDLDKGEVQAAIIDDVQQKALQGLPLAQTLETVLSGPELPGAIVSAVGAPVKGLSEALASVCEKSPKICADMRVNRFAPEDGAVLADLAKKLTTP